MQWQLLQSLAHLTTIHDSPRPNTLVLPTSAIRPSGRSRNSSSVAASTASDTTMRVPKNRLSVLSRDAVFTVSPVKPTAARAACLAAASCAIMLDAGHTNAGVAQPLGRAHVAHERQAGVHADVVRQRRQAAALPSCSASTHKSSDHTGLDAPTHPRSCADAFWLSHVSVASAC